MSLVCQVALRVATPAEDGQRPLHAHRGRGCGAAAAKPASHTGLAGRAYTTNTASSLYHNFQEWALAFARYSLAV